MQKYIAELKAKTESLEVNMVILDHCFRCHCVMESGKFHLVKGLPAIVYDSSSLCDNCRDKNVNIENVKRYLPTQEEGILCKCPYTSCQKEFYARPSWILYYYVTSDQRLRDWQPTLIERDIAKIKQFFPNWEQHEFLVDYINSLDNNLVVQ